MLKNFRFILATWILPALLLFYACGQFIHINKSHDKVVSIYQIYETSTEIIKSYISPPSKPDKEYLQHKANAELYAQFPPEMFAFMKVVTAEWYLSIMSMVCALLSLFCGILAQRFCLRCRDMVGHSEDGDVSLFNWFRNLLGWTSAAQLLFMILALLTIIVFDMLWFSYQVKKNESWEMVYIVGETLAGFIGVVLLCNLVKVADCLRLFTIQARVLCAIPLTEQDEPQLWQWLRTLCAEHDVALPDNIVVGMNSAYYATTEPLQIKGGPRLTGVTLYLPLRQIATVNKRRLSDDVLAALGDIKIISPYDEQDLLTPWASLELNRLHSDDRLKRHPLADALLNPALTLCGLFLGPFSRAINENVQGQLWTLSSLTIKNDAVHAAGLFSSLRYLATRLAQQLPQSGISA